MSGSIRFRPKVTPRALAVMLVGLTLAISTSEAQQPVVPFDSGNSRAVYQLAALRRPQDLDEAIVLYRRYVALEPSDAWGYLALGNALAARGDLRGARAMYLKARRLAPNERDVQEALARVQRRIAGWIELGGSSTRDSDGITAFRIGASVASSDLGRARVLASVGRGGASDALASRGSLDALVGMMFRPTRMSLELGAGAQRIDRSYIDTTGGGPGQGVGPGGIGRRPGTQSTTELVPVGRARLVWSDAARRLRIDARASRVVLDASPYLVAQGVRREEIAAELDLRVAGPIRVRAFGRSGTVYNEAEANDRRIIGAAIAWAPRSFDVSLRGQELSYGGPTALAYFAPQYVRTLELTTYVEREVGDVQLALDAGAGAQQVAVWNELPSKWSPTARAWMQVVKPLTTRLSLGVEGEAYDSRVGTDMPAFELPAGRWRYGSLRMWLRAGM